MSLAVEKNRIGLDELMANSGETIHQDVVIDNTENYLNLDEENAPSIVFSEFTEGH
jgi:hypothetical protein